MAAGRRKVSFILQFTDAGTAEAASPVWRGALEEVSSGERKALTTVDGLVGVLAAHGVALGREEPGGLLCEPCAAAARSAGEGT